MARAWPIGVALSLACTNVALGQTIPSSPAPVLVDRDLTPAAGASVTLALARLAADAEDRVVPLRLFEDRGRLRRGANATYRLAKLELFDQPQENWFRVANHEVFGHGARIRELFDGHIHYDLPAPPPYGRGGGATFFELDEAPTAEEALAITVGGMEANYVMARLMARDAITEGRWQYREARRYLYSEYDTIRYIRDVHDVEEEGHDVGDFRRIYNSVAEQAGEPQLSARTLRRQVLASFANPLIAYSYFSSYISYVWLGHDTAPVPTLHFGATRYLPMARFHLTSFGTEFVIDNAFVRNGRFADVTVSIGQTVGARTWGIGLEATRLTSIARWTLDAEGTLWHRPEWGGQLSATARHALTERRGRVLALVVQAGYKTQGYAPGDPLREGVFARVGAALTPSSRQSP